MGRRTRIHTGVQAAVVAIHQSVPELRCAVCSYEEHTELELSFHYVHQHRHGDAGPRKGQRRSAVPRSAAVSRDIVDLTAGSCDVAEAEEELYVDVPETDNHAVSGELSPYDIDDSGPSARADYVTRDEGTTLEARQLAADVREPEPDYDEPARSACPCDDAVPDSGAGAICPISAACEIVPRTAGPGGRGRRRPWRSGASSRFGQSSLDRRRQRLDSTRRSCARGQWRDSANRRGWIHRRVSQRLGRLGRTVRR